MQFKDIKQGYPVYILHTDELKASNGKVINVSQPYFPNTPPFNPTQQPFNPTTTQRMVDITIEIEGRTQTYSVPENSQIVNTPDKMVISCEKEGLIREVEAIKATKEERLKSREKDEKDVQACDDILSNWSPELAAKKEQDKRLNEMEGKIGNMEGMLKEIMQHIKGNKEGK